MSETPGRVRYPGPDLGEHSEEIHAGELVLSGTEVSELREEGVVEGEEGVV